MTTLLTQQVACTSGALDAALLERVRHETLTVPDGWVTEYGDYQSGGWGTLSLLNASGVATDVTITDCEPVETSVLASMPATKQLLSGLGFHYMWARIARLTPGSFLWEHRDYGELQSVERYRLHIPIVTSPSAFLVLAGSAVHLAAGALWRLTPTFVHGACNLYGPTRIHLILDCYTSAELDALIADQQLPDNYVRHLPPLHGESLQQQLDQAICLARLGYSQAAEQHLLRLFFKHSLPEGRAYDLISDMYDAIGAPDIAQRWRSRKSILLGLTA
ncbi:aspartyl/asparaginyl beta-hydroxylase domain-containing protein [Streptosporangium amethystogenes]|uniref:aspartyl/asparaginyl beta-hydroxylase domain-containing protein n=1 Tax=Streptosporangium amethystogenes TaxID=2002 RepID=UPI0006905E7D|nr:aspartyl/asparaginyl beta-hydroxylase domain-containing protein [Streptosporangium amethystogenes]